jgi:hypothetical protein
MTVNGDSDSDQLEQVHSFYADEECECELEQLEDALCQIEREQERESGEVPFETLPEIEQIFENECIM